MTNGQLQQLQDLSKCYNLPHYDKVEVVLMLYYDATKLISWQKALLRRLTHQYRHQISAIRKNQNATQN